MITLGLIGCGQWGKHFVRLLSTLGQGELRLVCDCDPEPIKFLQRNHLQFQTTFNYKEVLTHQALNAVIIATPAASHFELAKIALENNKHVLIEKPLALDSSELAVLRNQLEVAAKRDLVITSCHPRRFDPPFVWLKDHSAGLIDELGPVIHFAFDFSYHEPTMEWKRCGRSLMMDHLNHEVDLLNFLYGYQQFTASCLVTLPTRYEVSGMRSDDISFHFQGTRQLAQREFIEVVRVRHSRGEVTVNSHTGIATIYDHEKGQTSRGEIGSTNYALRSARVMKNFAQAIAGTAENYLTNSDLWINNWAAVKLLEEDHCNSALNFNS